MVGRGCRAKSPMVTRAPLGKGGVESALSLVAPSFSAIPLACGAGGSLPSLTCLARALFHTLLSSVWAWVSLLRSSAAGQRVSPLLRPPGDLDAATHDRKAQITQAARRLGCALRSRPRSHTRLLRGTATRGGAPGSLPAHTRTHAPRPQASRRQETPALLEASKDRIPSLDDGTASYPTPSSSLSNAPCQSTASLTGAPLFSCSPQLCVSPLPCDSQHSHHLTYPTIT